MTDTEDRQTQALTEQLLRYAEDLQRLMENQRVLESRFDNLSHLANFDMLTGLPNRRLFLDRLAPMMNKSRRPDDSFTLIFIDLDGFKGINDKYGHHVGDRVLQTTARRLTALVRESDTVARLGGDEFVVIARSLMSDANIDSFCTKAIQALSQSFSVEGQELSVGCSLGCAEFPRHGEDDITLLTHADAAMYRAKAAGGNSYCIYSPEPS